MIVTATGNIGLGLNTAPTRQFSLDNGTNVYMSYNAAGVEKWAVGVEPTVSNRFIFYDTVTGAYRMTLLTNGNVGIGTVAPTARLEVIDGAIRAHEGTNTPPTAGEGMELRSTGGTGYLGSFNRGTAAYRPMYFYASQYEWDRSGTIDLRLRSDGYVAITNRLYIGGNAAATLALQIATDSAGKPTTK